MKSIECLSSVTKEVCGRSNEMVLQEGGFAQHHHMSGRKLIRLFQDGVAPENAPCLLHYHWTDPHRPSYCFGCTSLPRNILHALLFSNQLNDAKSTVDIFKFN